MMQVRASPVKYPSQEDSSQTVAEIGQNPITGAFQKYVHTLTERQAKKNVNRRKNFNTLKMNSPNVHQEGDLVYLNNAMLYRNNND